MPMANMDAYQRRMITLSIMLATMMQALDGTIANVALPHMQGSLSTSQEQITWVLTSYLIASAIATPLTGWLAGRFGQRALFLASIGGFTVASVLCGLSSSLAEMVIARLLQGVFGAALVPLSQAVLLDINPPERHGVAMSVWGMGVMLGPILGPTLGGWLTDSHDWRWVFYINVPVGLLAFYGIWRFIDAHPAPPRTRFDVFGFGALALAIGALQILLDRGEHNGWFESAETWIEAVIMSVSLMYFAVHTVLSPAGQSFLDLRLFRNPNFVAGLAFISIVSMVLFSTRILMPTMLQSLMHYPAIDAGLVTAPGGIGTVLAMLLAGRLNGRIDNRLLLGAGFGITAFSLWQMSRLTLVLAPSDVVWPGVLQGFGLGLVFVPISTATFATLAPELRAQGSGLYSLMRHIGSSIGIAMVQTLLVRNTQVAHESIAGHVSDASLAGMQWDAGSAAMLALNEEVTRQATMIAYVDDFWLMMILAMAAIALVILIRPAARPADPGKAAP